MLTSSALPNITYHEPFAVKVTITNRQATRAITTLDLAASSTMLHRSIPAQENLRIEGLNQAPVINPKTHRYMKSPKTVSANTPTEFEQRFKSRPTTTPKIVELDSGNIHMPKDMSFSRGVPGFFPPVKLRTTPGPGSAKSTTSVRSATAISPMNVELIPNINNGIASRTRSKSRTSIASRDSSFRQESPRATVDETPNTQAVVLKQTDFDDLTYLPKPKKVLKREESPWAFRYRVKKNMNSLSKIMASKPSSFCEYIW